MTIIPFVQGQKITRAVRSFLENYERRLESVPIPEKKDMTLMVVDKIVVGRRGERDSATVHHCLRSKRSRN